MSTLMDQNAVELNALGQKLFSDRTRLDQMWQMLAEEFYPERADFTKELVQGDDFGRHLAESTPAQYRRDLANSMGAILRPRGKSWFKPMPRDDWRKTDSSKRWLAERGETMRTFIYAKKANFRNAWAEGDNDFVSFGNAVHSLTENRERDGLLFQTYHLRDVAWAEDDDRVVNTVHRKFKRSLINIANRWGYDKLSPENREAVEKNPHKEIELRQVCLPRLKYDPYSRLLKKSKFPFVCVYIDPHQQRILEETGYHEFPFFVRRWLLGRSQYAFSPAANLGICDARLLQAQAHTIQEAGERAVNPPMLATQDAFLGNLIKGHAGGVTWVDGEYDGALSDAVKVLDTGANLPLGLELKSDTRNILAAAWYLNKLNLPSDRSMTAYEVEERISEYIRSVGPVFEPFEVDNAQMLDQVFTMLWRITANLQAVGQIGPFGDLSQVPQELSDAEVDFEFDTPVQMAYARQKANTFREGIQLAAETAKAKPEVLDNIDADRGLRESLEGIGWDARWLKPAEVVEQGRQQQRMAAAKQQQMQELSQMGDMATKAMQVLPNAGAAKQGMAQLLEGQDGADAEDAALLEDAAA